MADLGLTNAIRELISVMRQQAGLPAGGSITTPHPFGSPKMGGISTSGLPQEWHDDMKRLTDGLEDHGDVIKDHGKEFKKASEDWQRGMVNMTFMMAPVAEGLSQFTKWTINRPIELMGGEGGRAARGGLERAAGIGNVAFDLTSAIAALTGNIGLAAGIQLVGRAGGATWLGGALFGRERLAQAGLEQNVLQDYGTKQMQAEDAVMFRARSARLHTQAAAWGAGLNVSGTIQGLAKELNEDPRVIQNALSEAFRIGGTRGIKNIDTKDITDMVREGFGDAATLIAIQATAGRYGYGRGEIRELTDRTGLRPEEMIPLMQRTRMQYYMFGGQTAEDINRFVSNTAIGAMNPMMGLQKVSQAAEGAAGVQNEAGEMLQFRAFQQANPGASYMDFIEAKKSGFGSGAWRRTVGLIAMQGARGGQEGRLLAAGMGVGRPLEIGGIAETYAEGFGSAARRAGKRTPDEVAEDLVRTRGLLTATALTESVSLGSKAMTDLAGAIKGFTDQVAEAVKTTATAKSHVAEMTKVMSQNTSALGGSLGKRPSNNVPDWLPGG